MISNPKFIYYSCIARGTTILAQYRSKEPKIEELAAECLAKAPPHHTLFSHTVKERTYTFLIDQPFVYFAIFDVGLTKSESLWFLNRMKCALEDIIERRSMTGSDNFVPLCFQAQFDSIFRQTMALDSDMEDWGDPRDDGNDSGDPNLDSLKGKRSVKLPLLGIKGLKKKKRVGMETNGMDGTMENKVDVCDDVNGCNRDRHLSVPKGVVNDRQKAKQIWKKHVWVVLLLDVFVCAVLFVIWLWVCKGIKCMES